MGDTSIGPGNVVILKGERMNEGWARTLTVISLDHNLNVKCCWFNEAGELRVVEIPFVALTRVDGP